jgi:ABC-type thiamine transport system substrate-binding protein
MAKPKQRSIAFSLLLLGVLFCATELSNAASIEEIALMNRADRQKILVEGAKKEGRISWYTTLIVDQVVRPVKEAFEKEYPFIQIEFFRGNAERLVQKMFAEYQAKRYEVDIIDGTVSPTMVRRANLLQRFYSPALAEYPAELKDAQGYWGSTNLYFFATGYNTKMVKPTDVPKTYEDLLNPRWKGQMMWSTSRGSGGPIFVGNVLNTMGAEAGKAFLHQQNRRRAGGLAAARAGDRDDSDHRAREKHAAPVRGDAAARLRDVGARPESLSTSELSAVSPEGTGQASGFEARRGSVQTRLLHQS